MLCSMTMIDRSIVALYRRLKDPNSSENSIGDKDKEAGLNEVLAKIKRRFIERQIEVNRCLRRTTIDQ